MTALTVYTQADDNGYVALYRGQRAEVRAATSHQAQQAVARVWKVPAYKVAVMLADKGGKAVTHAADF